MSNYFVLSALFIIEPLTRSSIQVKLSTTHDPKGSVLARL